MKRSKRCPHCEKDCRVAANGKSGYCKTLHANWILHKVDPTQLVPGPIRHQLLPQPLLELARWTYGVVGGLLYPTFEQWELGFLRDTSPATEILIWVRVAKAYAAFLKWKGRDPLTISQEEGLLLVASIMRGSDAQPFPPEHFDNVKDETVRVRLAELNHTTVIKELIGFLRISDPKVPSEYIDSVKNEAVRELLRKLNEQVRKVRQGIG